MNEEILDETKTLLVEINPEKRMVSINNYDDKLKSGIVKRYRNRHDILKLIGRFIYENIDIYTSNFEVNDKNDKNKNRKSKRKNK